jgi:hypothetical protein
MMQFLCEHCAKVRKGFFNAFGVLGVAMANANQRYQRYGLETPES